MSNTKHRFHPLVAFEHYKRYHVVPSAYQFEPGFLKHLDFVSADMMEAIDPM